ncbi:MAG: hypothetical protein U0903_03485 [Planctomycetales bacterium]
MYHLYMAPPEIPPLYPVDGLRNYFRNQWQDVSAAMISVDVLQVRGMALVRSVFKRRLKDNRQYYTGQLVLPYRDFCYALDVATIPEVVPTERETTIHELLSSQAEPSQAGQCSLSWGQDPYSDTVKGEYLANPSDEETWDRQFTTHGLTVVRSTLAKIVATIMATRELRNSVPFSGTTAP